MERILWIAFVFLLSARVDGAFAWTSTSTFPIETGEQLSYVVGVPFDPNGKNIKWPVVIYEQGDSTADLLQEFGHFTRR